MKWRLPHGALVLAVSGMALAVALGTVVFRGDLVATTRTACPGRYADTLQTMNTRTREVEQGPQGQYSYLVRSQARYECPFFGSDGKLRRKYVRATEHGTAFAYERAPEGGTFLLTNEHLASWHQVTDGDHRVEGVPEGCRLVEETVRIVQDEHDEFEPGHIPLTKVAVDPRLDAAILKTAQNLTVLPYRIGESAALREGNGVQVRGFPLGIMQAVNTGKVVNPYDRDLEQGWDHVDFVIDALLSEGNSGSPVLAVSCRTGELELVGMYHAGYKGHNALNVVVGIDQLREFMKKKKRLPRPLTADGGARGLGASDRERLAQELTQGALPFFRFGQLVVRTEAGPETLLFSLYSRDFPLDDRRSAVIEDRPDRDAFGRLGRIWIRGHGSWRLLTPDDLGQEDQELVTGLLEALRWEWLRTSDYRQALGGGTSSDERRRGRELSRLIARAEGANQELATSFLDLAERLAPSRMPLVPKELAKDSSKEAIREMALGETTATVPGPSPVPPPRESLP